MITHSSRPHLSTSSRRRAISGTLPWRYGLQRKDSSPFEDTAEGGFFSTREGSPDILLRIKDDYDGAEPSANSVAIDVLLRLAHWTGQDALFRASGASAALLCFETSGATHDGAAAPGCSREIFDTAGTGRDPLPGRRSKRPRK